MDEEREEELESLTAIYPELVVDASNPFSASLELPVHPAKPLLVRFVPPKDDNTTYADAAAYIERDVELSHLPPITIHMTLPQEYPASRPPKVRLSARSNWLPEDKIAKLEAEAANLWEEYGHSQILFAYIGHVQDVVERGFDLHPLVSTSTREEELVRFDSRTEQETFNVCTYDCGVCLEPKKGAACHKMRYCGHVFCRQCLQDFYNNAIKEGDVANVCCLDPTCGEEKTADGKKKPKKERALHPRELLAMGLEESVARRYVEMKRKKKLEADKTTVYCPRTWCQSAAKNSKYPPVPADLMAYVEHEAPDDKDDTEKSLPATGKVIPHNPADRLAICEKCQFAFCQVCYKGWHGPNVGCHPRNPNELSAEEKASFDYIRMHTSPCPYCNAPVQKTMGCNHMECYQCHTHFCYLCGSWLDGNNPYQHFNKAGSPCYQRLWELEEGDEGQAPGDGQGFAGGVRGWEQLALEVARQADVAEAEAAAAQAQADEDAQAARAPDLAGAEIEDGLDDIPIAVALAQIELNNLPDFDDSAEPPAVPLAARRHQNPFYRAPARGAAQAVRNHERAGVRGGRRRGPGARAGDGQGNLDDREQEQLQRFLEMARRDEEDGWDSDELDGDDDRFIIPNR